MNSKATVHRIHKHMTISRPHPLSLFYVRIINVCSLCYGKCVTHVKDGLSFIKCLKSVYSSYTIHIHEAAADIFGGHFFLQILMEGYSELLILPFLSCLLYHISSAGVFCYLLWTYNIC